MGNLSDTVGFPSQKAFDMEFWSILQMSPVLHAYIHNYHLVVTTQPEPGRIKQGWGTSVELTGFIHGNEKPWNNKYNTI